MPIFQLLNDLVVSALRPLPAAASLMWSYNNALRRMMPHHVARTRDGVRMHCDVGDFIPARIFHFGVWEPNNTALIKRVLRPGDVFVDVGANIGYYALLASKLVGPGGGVVAVEASPSIGRRLERNLALNAVANVRVVHEAASDAAGTKSIFAGSADNSGSTTTIASLGGGLEAEIPARPLGQMLTEDERRRTRLIKIDVEGAEEEVIRGLLQADWPEEASILVEIKPDVAGSIASVFQALRGRGFTAYDVPNAYDWGAYLSWTSAAPLRPLDGLPATQTDVFFTRRPLP